MRPTLQRAYGGGTHRHDAPTPGLAVGNGLLGGRGHLVPLAVHLVLGQVFGLDRLEGAGAHVQGDVSLLHTHGCQLVQQGLVKVQGGSGGGYSAGVFGKNGLVAQGVLGRIAVGDVERKRHMAVALHQRVGVVTQIIAQHKTK